jgi:23S rRNA (guanine745-N1)-methyltransferase
VDEQKAERVDSTLGGHFTLQTRQTLEHEARLDHEETAALIGMGPSAHHISAEELRRRLSELPDPLPVPLSFVVSAYRPVS